LFLRQRCRCRLEHSGRRCADCCGDLDECLGDIVKQVGGDAVAVTAVISDPSADPHSYEANAQTQLALAKAQLVVENGGGYDDFMDQMLSSSNAQVLNAVQISGKAAAAGDELNEHVWYDFPTVDKVAAQVATELGVIDPANAATFTANAAALSTNLAGLAGKVEAIKAAHAGTPMLLRQSMPSSTAHMTGLRGTLGRPAAPCANCCAMARATAASAIAMSTPGTAWRARDRPGAHAR